MGDGVQIALIGDQLPGLDGEPLEDQQPGRGSGPGNGEPEALPAGPDRIGEGAAVIFGRGDGGGRRRRKGRQGGICTHILIMLPRPSSSTKVIAFLCVLQPRKRSRRSRRKLPAESSPLLLR